MNIWTKKSVDLAKNEDYLDQLSKVYPISKNVKRVISASTWSNIEIAFNNRDSEDLVIQLLKLDLFPVKDSYIPYLRKEKNAIKNNPKTIERIANRVYKIGMDTLLEKCTEPKETNRQMGPVFKNWIDTNPLGVPTYKDVNLFLTSTGNALLNMSDAELANFACKYLGYSRNKGLDFVGRFNGKYVLGEAKFLTDFGGHQNAQFDDAISTMNSKFNSNGIINATVIIIGIMDGVLYIQGENKLYKHLVNNSNEVILSALLLKDYLIQV